MIYFQDWWSVGENCIITRHTGVIADDKTINDCCIWNNEQLNLFKDSIAVNVITHQEQKDYSIEMNSDDPFLNNKIPIDFNETLIIVISNAEIKEVLYSKVFECYMVKYSDKSLNEKTYCAALLKRYNTTSNKIKMEIMNDKPEPIKLKRPINNNEDY